MEKLRGENGTIRIRYLPNGADHELQRAITELLHKIVMDNGDVTLGELGYLHCNTITATKGIVDIKLYFLRELATVQTRQANSKKKLAPSPHFDMFSGYLFVGDVMDNITYECTTIPKYKIERNSRGNNSVVIKNKEKVTEEEVLIVHCNLPITMAAIEDVSLADPEFKVEFETVGKGGKSTIQNFITIADHSGHPVRIIVTHSNKDEYKGFDYEATIPYLVRIATANKAIAQNQRNLQDNINKKAKKQDEKNSKKKYSGFNKYA